MLGGSRSEIGGGGKCICFLANLTFNTFEFTAKNTLL